MYNRDWGGDRNKLYIQSMVTAEVIEFWAFLTDVSQTFDQTWNTTEVHGRNDPIATFQSTKRSFSLSLEIPAGSLAEAQSNWNKCGKLSSFMYPGYIVNEHTSWDYIGRPPLLKIKFANIIASMADSTEGLLGYVDSVSFTPSMEAGMYGVGGNLYPKVISLSFGFNALHQVDLGHYNVDDEGELDDDGKWIGWIPGKDKLPFL